MVQIWIYLLVVNIIGLLAIRNDKKRAERHAWRISEKKLFGISLIGGSIGTWLGIYLWHHKTKHWYFVVGMPAILLIQLAICLYWYFG